MIPIHFPVLQAGYPLWIYISRTCLANCLCRFCTGYHFLVHLCQCHSKGGCLRHRHKGVPIGAAQPGQGAGWSHERLIPGGTGTGEGSSHHCTHPWASMVGDMCALDLCTRRGGAVAASFAPDAKFHCNSTDLFSFSAGPQ